jgi:hypothetical protein
LSALRYVTDTNPPTHFRLPLSHCPYGPPKVVFQYSIGVLPGDNSPQRLARSGQKCQKGQVVPVSPKTNVEVCQGLLVSAEGAVGLTRYRNNKVAAY